MRSKPGFLGYAIDYSTAATSAKDHRVRTFERLNRFDVVKIAIVLHVVTHSVHKKIRAGAVAPNHQLVAIVFALVRRNAWYVSDNISDATQRLVPDLFLCNQGD